MKTEETIELFPQILAARGGDKAAFERLFRMYRPMLSRAVFLYSRPDSPFLGEEDLRQEASVAFYRAIMTYSPDHGDISFGLYARRCVSNRILSALRFAGRHDIPTGEIPEYVLSPFDPLEGVLAKERMESIRKGAESLLSPYENRVFGLLCSGHSVEEISRLTDRTPRSVGNAVFRIRTKLASLL